MAGRLARDPAGKTGPVAPRGLDISVSAEPTAIVIAVRGELDLAMAPRLVERFEEALRGGPERVVLDLRAVAFTDSTGLAALIRCRRRAVRADVELVLDVGDGPVADLLDLTGLHRVFAFR